jgi:hypothetical protein
MEVLLVGFVLEKVNLGEQLLLLLLQLANLLFEFSWLH